MKKAHLFAIFTILLWSTTYLSSKVLLTSFSPIEILFIRFVLGFLTLSIMDPKWISFKKEEEPYFILAGFFGITLYYLLENIALLYTFASNVGIIIVIAPFFTSIFMRQAKNAYFLLGFVVSMIGVILISLNGSQFQVSPIGDCLACLAAIVWAIYSICIKKITSLGYPVIQITKKVFAYGILGMIIPIAWMGFDVKWQVFTDPINLFNILYLGCIGCAICFVSWNYATKTLGTLQTSVYIYLSPFFTVFSAALILHEPITEFILLGTILTLAGLILSEKHASTD